MSGLLTVPRFSMKRRIPVRTAGLAAIPARSAAAAKINGSGRVLSAARPNQSSRVPVGNLVLPSPPTRVALARTHQAHGRRRSAGGLGRSLPFVAVLAALAATVLLVSPAWARPQQSACGTTQNYQQGQSTVSGGSQPIAIEGASAIVTDGGGWLICLSDTNGNINFDTTYVMIQASNGYSQSGLMYRYGFGSCIKLWAQQREPGKTAVDAYAGGCSSLGNTWHFWEQSVYISPSWHMRANVNSTIIRQSSTNPFAWGTPFYATFNSEVYHYNSNISGTSTYHTKYSSMQVQRYSDNAWASTCGNARFGRAAGPAPFNLSVTSCSSQESWTA